VSALSTVNREVLTKVGLYHRVKMSRLYELYWFFADRRIVERKRAEIAFYGALLR
jgi:hypothetical protein